VICTIIVRSKPISTSPLPVSAVGRRPIICAVRN
jgi:hypothetical protein